MRRPFPASYGAETSRTLDQKTTHCRRRHSQEVIAVLVRHPIRQEALIDLVDKYGGLQTVSPFTSEKTPTLDPLRQAWLERGGVYAVCHPRGGGEKGTRWRLAGQGRNKPRGVKDVQACGQYLITEGLTQSSRLTERV